MVSTPISAISKRTPLPPWYWPSAALRPDRLRHEQPRVRFVGAYEYRPPYVFSGFLQPVDNLPFVNVAKAGAAIPVKFSLQGNRGLDIFAANSPSSQQIACPTSAPIDEIEVTVAAGNSSLTYDAASDTYTYVWKTNTAWKNTCRQFTLKFNEGTTASASFQFK